MYTILGKRTLAQGIREYVVEAPLVAKAAKAGQFVVIRLHERGERIPLTLADWDAQAGTVTLVVQAVGKTSFSIAHRLATIRASSRIMVLNGGVIVEFASHDELMAKQGFYYALYVSQFKGKVAAGLGAQQVDFVST